MKNASTRSKDQVLYFRVVEYNGKALVFAPPKKAEEHDRLMKALERSKTWGEFKAAISASDLREIKELMREREELSAAEIRERIADDQPFQVSDVPGTEDAEFPSMLMSIQDRFLPPSIVEKYAKRWGAFNCLDIVRIDTSNLEAILGDLRALGFEVIERSDLEFF